MTIPKGDIAIRGAGKTSFQNLMRRSAEPSLRCVIPITEGTQIPDAMSAV